MRSAVEPSDEVPIAVKALACPFASETLGGETSIRTTTGGSTWSVRPVEPIPASCAEIWTVPAETPRASPCVPVAFEIEAAAPDELQVTSWVRSRVAPPA
ncbi:MAG TPA: hypothetical protein VF875_18405 [Anaeromyxobacter sp.]